MIIGVLSTASSTPAPPASGLVLRLRGDLGITPNGSNVAAWADQSGNGNNVAEATAGLQPAITASSINGRAAVTFAGTQGSSAKVLAGTTRIVPATHARTMYTVLKLNTNVATAYNQLMAWTTGLGGAYNWLASGGPAADNVVNNDVSNNSRGYTTTFSPSIATPYLIKHTFSGTIDVNTNMTFTVNNSPQTATSSAGLTTEAGTDGFTIGGLRSDGFQLSLNADICEMLVYDHVVTAPEDLNVRTYVESWYGIALGAP